MVGSKSRLGLPTLVYRKRARADLGLVILGLVITGKECVRTFFDRHFTY